MFEARKKKSRIDIWSCTAGKPFDTTGDILVDFGAALEIWICSISVRDGVYGVARAVGCHVGSSVELVDAKALTSEFGEGRLAQTDREVAIVTAIPGEGSTEEIFNVTHEVNFKFGLK